MESINKILNAYEWNEKYLLKFLEKLNLKESFKTQKYVNSILVSDGDKCSQYQILWEDNGVPFEHGMALYLLGKIHPYSSQVRETDCGWVDPCQWVIANYPIFKSLLGQLITEKRR